MVMGPPSPQLAPADWLGHILDHGPKQLPYAPEAKFAIRQHLVDLVTDFPTLLLKLQQYTHTNGNTVPLLMAEGTLPMYYQGVKYNIPVSIWLPEGYPRYPPIMYVLPTPDMIIKPHHSFVDASGVVSSPYVRNWIYPRSNLVDMAQDTSIQFGQDPPLFSKPPNWVPPVVHTPPHSRPSSAQADDTFQAHNPIHGPSHAPVLSSSGGIWGGAVAAMTAAQQPSQPQASPEEAFRARAVAELTGRARASLVRANDAATADMDGLLRAQAELGRRQREVDRGVQATQAERPALEACVLEMSGKAAALERWLADNESKQVAGDIDPDAAIVPADVLSRQALEGQAEDLALEDALYSLDKALQAGVLTPDAYIKQVRGLCGKQFMVRALGKKVADRQDHLRRAFQGASSGGGGRGGASGLGRAGSVPGPSHVQMPQGDSWIGMGILSNPLTAPQPAR